MGPLCLCNSVNLLAHAHHHHPPLASASAFLPRLPGPHRRSLILWIVKSSSTLAAALSSRLHGAHTNSGDGGGSLDSNAIKGPFGSLRFELHGAVVPLGLGVAAAVAVALIAARHHAFLLIPLPFIVCHTVYKIKPQHSDLRIALPPPILHGLQQLLTSFQSGILLFLLWIIKISVKVVESIGRHEQQQELHDAFRKRGRDVSVSPSRSEKIDSVLSDVRTCVLKLEDKIQKNYTIDTPVLGEVKETLTSLKALISDHFAARNRQGLTSLQFALAIKELGKQSFEVLESLYPVQSEENGSTLLTNERERQTNGSVFYDLEKSSLELNVSNERSYLAHANDPELPKSGSRKRDKGALDKETDKGMAAGADISGICGQDELTARSRFNRQFSEFTGAAEMVKAEKTDQSNTSVVSSCLSVDMVDSVNIHSREATGNGAVSAVIPEKTQDMNVSEQRVEQNGTSCMSEISSMPRKSRDVLAGDPQQRDHTSREQSSIDAAGNFLKNDLLRNNDQFSLLASSSSEESNRPKISSAGSSSMSASEIFDGRDSQVEEAETFRKSFDNKQSVAPQFLQSREQSENLWAMPRNYLSKVEDSKSETGEDVQRLTTKENSILSEKQSGSQQDVFDNLQRSDRREIESSSPNLGRLSKEEFSSEGNNITSAATVSTKKKTDEELQRLMRTGENYFNKGNDGLVGKLEVGEAETMLYNSTKKKTDEELQRLMSTGENYFNKGKDGLVGKLEVGEAETMLYKAADMFASAVTVDPSSLEAVGFWGNVLLVHGELKLKLSKELRKMLPSQESSRQLGRVNQNRRKESAVERTLQLVCEECEQLLVEAGRKYRMALSLDKSDVRALYNWGLALCFRAQLIAAEGKQDAVGAADRLYLAAIDKFEAMMGISKKAAPAGMLNWGLALRDRSRLRPPGSQERVSLMQQAKQLFEDALRLHPNDLQIRGALTTCRVELQQMEERTEASSGKAWRSKWGD